MKGQSEATETPNREDESAEYLKNHKILELLNNLTAQLVFHKPDTPRDFIVEHLEKLKKSKLASLNPPSLFEDSNLQSIFGMLDPSGRGFITFRQYIQALETLGVSDYEKNPDGKDEDRIRTDTLIKEAKKGLNKVNATFKPNSK